MFSFAAWGVYISVTRHVIFSASQEVIPVSGGISSENTFETNSVATATSPNVVEDSKKASTTSTNLEKSEPITPAIQKQEPKKEPEPVKPPVSQESFDYDPHWRDASVNLFCSNRYAEGSVMSGSGTIIDPRGIILTNAHVAIDHLFANWPQPTSFYDCSVRTGSPAQPTYRAKILYIPDQFVRRWIDTLFVADDPSYIYGKHDYALFVIVGRTNPAASLPSSFPYIRISEDPVPAVGSSVYLQGYPAEFLGDEAVLKSLHALSTRTAIVGTKSLLEGPGNDAVWFDKTIASQHGASGGAMISKGGVLAGLMTFFDEVGNTTDDQVLNAITIPYINADIAANTGLTLSQFLQQHDPQTTAKEYAAGKGLEYVQEIAKIARQKADLVIPGSGL